MSRKRGRAPLSTYSFPVRRGLQVSRSLAHCALYAASCPTVSCHPRERRETVILSDAVFFPQIELLSSRRPISTSTEKCLRLKPRGEGVFEVHYPHRAGTPRRRSLRGSSRTEPADRVATAARPTGANIPDPASIDSGVAG